MLLTILNSTCLWLETSLRRSNQLFAAFHQCIRPIFEREYPELSISLQLLKHLKISFFANIDNLLKASDHG